MEVLDFVWRGGGEALKLLVSKGRGGGGESSRGPPPIPPKNNGPLDPNKQPCHDKQPCQGHCEPVC